MKDTNEPEPTSEPGRHRPGRVRIRDALVAFRLIEDGRAEIEMIGATGDGAVLEFTDPEELQRLSFGFAEVGGMLAHLGDNGFAATREAFGLALDRESHLDPDGEGDPIGSDELWAELDRYGTA